MWQLCAVLHIGARYLMFIIARRHKLSSRTSGKRKPTGTVGPGSLGKRMWSGAGSPWFHVSYTCPNVRVIVVLKTSHGDVVVYTWTVMMSVVELTFLGVKTPMTLQSSRRAIPISASIASLHQQDHTLATYTNQQANLSAPLITAVN